MCVTVFHSNCYKNCHWLFNPETIWECSTESFSLDNEWEAGKETKTILALKQNSFYGAPGGPQNSKELWQMETIWMVRSDESKKLDLHILQLLSLGESSCPPCPHPPLPMIPGVPDKNRTRVNWARFCVTSRHKPGGASIFAFMELPIQLELRASCQ